MRWLITALVLAGLAGPAQACRLALALAIDTSGSIDPGEYRFQMGGLADALEDPDVIDALLQAQAALTVVQWSGAEEQSVTIPWQRMLTPGAVARLSGQVRAAPRRFSDGRTAVGEALGGILPLFDAVSDCTRRVIDISGDGANNDGDGTAGTRRAAEARGVTVNAIAIDRIGRSVTEFYRRHVMTGKGAFVMTATGYSDYPRAIRLKLLREIVVPAS